jgi:hypothetical protein
LGTPWGQNPGQKLCFGARFPLPAAYSLVSGEHTASLSELRHDPRFSTPSLGQFRLLPFCWLRDVSSHG